MTTFWRYRSGPGVSPAWSSDLGNDAVRLGGVDGLVEMAEHCAVGVSTLAIDDPDADVGHSGDAILGLQYWEVEETAMAAGNTILYRGLTGVRDYSRSEGEDSSLILSSSRTIDVALTDLNALLNYREILSTDTDASRPKETVSARLAWILGSDYLAGLVIDAGLVVASTKTLDKAKYQGQRPVNVVADCELATGYNAFVYWSETDQSPALFFDDANTSTAYTSTLRISNVLADADSVTIPPAKGRRTRLSRSPEQTGSRVSFHHAKGTVNLRRSATEDTYPARDLPAQNSNVKSADRAKELGKRYLWEHRGEEDRITTAVDLTPEQVNLIRAGHRIQVKFSHLPGYTSFTWCRVVRRAVQAIIPTDQVYTLALELVPMEANEATCPFDATADQTVYPLGGPDLTIEPVNSGRPNPSDGIVYYLRAGVYYPTYPIPGYENQLWHFPSYGAGGSGTTDYMGDCAQNVLRFIVVGDGTLTINTATYGGSSRKFNVSRFGWVNGAASRYSFEGRFTSGASPAVVIDDTSAPTDCVTIVDVWAVGGQAPGESCGGKLGWTSASWVGA